MMILSACGSGEHKIAEQLYDCRSPIASSEAEDVLGQMGNCLFIRYGWKDTAKVIIAAKGLKNKTAQIAPVAKLLASFTAKHARSYLDPLQKVELREAYIESMRSSLRSLAESEERYFRNEGVSEVVQGGAGYAEKWVCDSRTPPNTMIFCMDSTNTLILRVTRKGTPERRWGGWSAVVMNPRVPNVTCSMFYNTAPVAPATEPLAATCQDVDSTTFVARITAVRDSLKAQAVQDSAERARRKSLQDCIKEA